MRRNQLVITAVILCLLSLQACGSTKEAAQDGKKQGAADTVQNENAADAAQDEDTADAVQAEDTADAVQAEDTADTVQEADAADVTQKADEAGAAQTDGNIYIRYDEEKEEYEAEDGTVLLTVERTLPVVTITDHEEAAVKINETAAAFIQDSAVDEIMEGAKADYEVRGKDNWYGYAISSVFSSARTDRNVISFFMNGYSDTGGAHPNAVESGINFDPETGERLTLYDVTEEEQAAAEKIREIVLKQAEQMEAENEGMFFDDYRESIGDILTEDTWVLAEDGMHIIANEYLIAPHAAGIIDFVIPYEEADFLKEAYR